MPYAFQKNWTDRPEVFHGRDSRKRTLFFVRLPPQEAGVTELFWLSRTRQVLGFLRANFLFVLAPAKISKIRNRNIEIRNKPKPAKPRFKSKTGGLELSPFWTFGFVSNFGFRIWDLSLRLCTRKVFPVSSSSQNFRYVCLIFRRLMLFWFPQLAAGS